MRAARTPNQVLTAEARRLGFTGSLDTLLKKDTATMTSTATVPAALTPLTIEQIKPGLRVILLEGAETGATRGRVIQVKHGWADVRFEDGVTRKARAKVLGLDTVQVVEQQPRGATVEESLAQVNAGRLSAILPPTVAPGSPAARALARKRTQAATPEALGKQLAAGRAAGTDALAEPAPKSRKARAKVASKPGQPCLCACGQDAKSGRSFLPGHDARFHGWMKRLADQRLKPSEVPAAALKLMNLDKDGVPTTDYDGSPWKP